MSSSNKQNKNGRNDELNFVEILNTVLIILLSLAALYFLKWVYFDVYKPQEKKYINNSRYVYKIIQEELTKYYREKGHVYSKEDVNIDEFCEVIRKKYSPLYGNCNVGTFISNEPNIVFKDKNIHIYGFEKPAFEASGTLVKDVIIDVDGKKGENTFGVDRVPIRIYSGGRLGGMLSPVNCRKEDLEEYGIPYSPICPVGFDFDFMDTNIPFGYDIIQVGGKDGTSRRLNQKVSFLRTDCMAFGSEIFGAEEYCDKKGYQWLTACYHEYFCAIKFHEKQ